MARATHAQVLELRRPQRSQGIADPDEVAELAAGMDTEHVKCRTIGHKWESWKVDELDDSTLGHTKEVTLRCERCHSVVPVFVSGKARRRGRRATPRLRGSIRYVDGYLVRGVGRINGEARDVLWNELVARAEGQAKSRRPMRRARA